MKKIIIAALAAAAMALMFSACKKGNDSKDEPSSQERTFTVLVETSEDVLKYFDLSFKYTLPGQEEKTATLNFEQLTKENAPYAYEMLTATLHPTEQGRVAKLEFKFKGEGAPKYAVEYKSKGYHIPADDMFEVYCGLEQNTTPGTSVQGIATNKCKGTIFHSILAKQAEDEWISK